MKIVVFTHSSISHVKSIEHILKLLACKNTIYCFLEKEHENIYGSNINIKYYYYTDEISLRLKKHLVENANKYNEKVNESIDDYVTDSIQALRYMLDGSMIYVDELLPIIQEIQPDYILRDSCSLFGRIIGDRLHIPVYGYVSSPAITDRFVEKNLPKYLKYSLQKESLSISDDKLSELYQKIKNKFEEVCNDYNVRTFPINYLTCPDEKINFCFGSYLTNMIDDSEKNKYFFMKPNMFFDEKYTLECNKENIIVASSGTIVSFPVKLYNYIINAYKNSEYQVNITQRYYGTGMISVNNLPKNIKFYNFINQREMVSKGKLLITHGGYNSVLESIFYRTPIIVYPISCDQFFIAEMIDDLSIGINLKKYELSGTFIRSISEELIHSKKVNDSLLKVRNSIIDINNDHLLEWFV